MELGRLFSFDWCSAGTRTGEGADEQEGKRDFRSASARSRAAKADGVYRRGSCGRVPPSAPVETRRRSWNLGAFFLSTGALQGLEPARAPTSRRKSATLGARQPEAVPQRPMAWTAEALCGRVPPSAPWNVQGATERSIAPYSFHGAPRGLEREPAADRRGRISPTLGGRQAGEPAGRAQARTPEPHRSSPPFGTMAINIGNLAPRQVPFFLENGERG
jgi:hypothetical protein